MPVVEKTFAVEGLHCPNCANNLRVILEEDVNGVTRAEVNLDQHQVAITFDDARFDFDKAAAATLDGGYTLIKP